MAARLHPEDAIQETLERARRTETRVTQLMTHFGVNPKGLEKPRFEAGSDRARIYPASPRNTLQELLDAIPVDWTSPVDVVLDRGVVATITPGRLTT